MVALPVIKLGTLALKKFGKPIANCLTREAIRHPKFRQHIVNFAEANQRLKRRVQRRIYDCVADDAPIQPGDEDKTVGDTVDLLKEFVLFTVAGATVIFELSETRKKEERSRLKEERRRQEHRQDNELLRQEHRQDNELLRQEHRQDNELLRQDNELLRKEHRHDNELLRKEHKHDNELLRQDNELLRQDNELLRKEHRQELQLIKELQLKQENELQLLRQDNELLRQQIQSLKLRQSDHEFNPAYAILNKKLQHKAINLNQNFFQQKEGEHEKKLEIKQLATFAFLILMHTHGNEGGKSKSI